MKEIKEIHLSEYEISSNDKITRIHFSNHMQEDGRLRVKFMEREVVGNEGEIVRDGSHDIIFSRIENIELARSYANTMKNIISNIQFKNEKISIYSAVHKDCKITANIYVDNKKDFIKAIELSLLELETKLNKETIKSNNTPAKVIGDMSFEKWLEFLKQKGEEFDKEENTNKEVDDERSI